MAHETHDVTEVPLRRLERVPGAVRLTTLGLLGVGIVALIAAFLTDPARAWRAYLFNWLFWTTIAQGAVVFAVAITMTRGIWGRSIRRIALSFVLFVPISFLLMLPLFFAGDSIFTWIGQEMHGSRAAYLNLPFLAVRNIVAMGVLSALSLWYAYWALRPDLALHRDDVPRGLQGLYDRMLRGWRGFEEERELAAHRLSVIGPIIGLVWAVAFSFVAWDLVMTLEEDWWSTLIGPYVFMGGFLGGVAATALLTVVYRAKLGLEKAIQPPQFHDLGKLTFAFCIFWGYLLWAQYIVMWYGNLPREQVYLLHRMAEPYIGLSLVVFLFLFVVPFFGLLGVAPKKRPTLLALFSSVVLVGLWIERYILIYPTFYHDNGELVLSWPEVGMALPFAGLFLASLIAFATRFPVLQAWDGPADVNLLETIAEAEGGEVVTY
ncbi:MAG TPA: hypothetical protein VF188_16035 [Longimicrobiales bacterium]